MTQNNQQNQNKSAISQSNEEMQQKIANSVTFHDNLGERILTTSESKLKLCLIDNLTKIGNRSAWQTPAGIFLTIVLTCLTANFKDWILPKETWLALFIFFGLLSLIWLINTLLKIPKLKTVDDIVDELMPDEKQITAKTKKK